jgi:hypothetical protein
MGDRRSGNLSKYGELFARDKNYFCFFQVHAWSALFASLGLATVGEAANDFADWFAKC